MFQYPVHLHGRRIPFGEVALMPVRIGQRRGAGRVELRDLLRRETSSRPREDSACELFFVARAEMTVDTVGRFSTQLSATCGNVFPVSLTTSSSASTTR